jgi:phosphopantetheinyl transferase (holo-ACP synthase)
LLDCILKNQPVLSEVEKSKILDLKQIPTSNDFSISISHSKDWGGFVTAQKHYLVGMDLEDPSRMKENLLKRIKNPHDHGASSPGIWSAKESAFKALSSYINSPKFNLVDIAVHNIEDANLGDKLRGFWYKFGTPDLGPNPKNLGKGLWVESEGQILAVSLFSP